MSGSEPEDWIELFLEWTDGIPSPKIFRQWSAICTIAGALERRVYIISAGRLLYPNMYVLLVGSPGVGKTEAINYVNKLWMEARELHVAPHDVTKAALIDELARASRKIITGETRLLEYNSLVVAADEFGVLVPSHDLEFLSTLNRIYDNPDQHRQSRRGLEQQIDIINPQINLIGGVQPAYLANLLPEEAWSMGFMSRVVMVYSAHKITQDWKLDDEASLMGQAPHQSALVSRMREMLKMNFRMRWNEDAKHVASSWDQQPIPEHPKMEHYLPRRHLHIFKLCIISAISRGSDVIDVLDFNRARDWLLEVEQVMPDIFREMVQRSDAQVMDEMHMFAWREWAKDRKPVSEMRLINFLKTRATTEKIPRILDMAVRSGMFEANGLGLFTPRPKHEHGVDQ